MYITANHIFIDNIIVETNIYPCASVAFRIFNKIINAKNDINPPSIAIDIFLLIVTHPF